ncbi:MAG: polysaccharide biosynthesis tyrosine autokinase [Chthoniobacter sp.]|nr:polysaccharide biosynthesis tyrosine autokinase [Chthoniobacter sp.]
MKQLRQTRPAVSLADDLQTILSILRSKALLIAGCMVVAATLGFLMARFSPKIYAAKTVIQVDQEEQRVVKIEGVRPEDLKAPEILKTYEQNILSSEVLLRVIQNHDLLSDPAFLPEANGNRSEKVLVDALARHLTAKIRTETRLIDITVEHRSPVLARRIAELLVEEFGKWCSQTRREAGERASAFLLERAGELSERLAKSEKALQDYKEKHATVSLDERQNFMTEKLGQLNLRWTEAKSERLRLEAESAQLRTAETKSPAELLAIPRIAGALQIGDLQKKIGDREAALATFAQRYKPEHPKYLAAQSELDELRSELRAEVRKTAEVLEAQYQTAKGLEERFEQAVRDQQQASLGVNTIGLGSAALAREVESNRALYESVLTRMKETEITKDLAQGAIHVVERPLLPEIPVRPKKTVILVLSIIAGLAVGGFLAFASHAADRSLQTLDDAEMRLGLRSLGEIPRLPGSPREANSPLLAGRDQAAAESFRTLRTSLSLLGDHAKRKSILFTSALPGEGKTFCSINCAVAFANQGLRTLLIDADLRLPGIARILLATENAPGLSDLLLGEKSLSEAVHPTSIAHLSVLPSGQRVPNVAELTSGVRLLAVLVQACADFDRVVIDTPPISVVSDALLLATHVDSVCLVIRAGHTPADEVIRATHRLAEAGAPPVGFVWNQVRRSRENHGYYERLAENGTAPRLLS